MIRLVAMDELMDDVCVCRCKILEMDSLSREEKTQYAEFLVNKEKENHPEYSYFHFEKDYSYFDEDSCWDYFYTIATEEEGLEGLEAEEYAKECFKNAIEEHYDLGFDF